jgi:hypothetical protein
MTLSPAGGRDAPSLEKLGDLALMGRVRGGRTLCRADDNAEVGLAHRGPSHAGGDPCQVLYRLAG